MLDGISAFLAITGFYAASLCLLRSYIKTSFDQNIHFRLLLSFIAWALSTGLRSIILVWGYSTNASLFSVYALNGAVGAILLVLSWPALKECRQRTGIFKLPQLGNKEKVILAFIIFVLMLYLYRVTIPWSDYDETLFYGYVSKLIAGGRTMADMIRQDGPIGFVRSQLVQCWDGQLYRLVNDTYLIRFDRLINFLFCGAGIFAFLRLMRVSRFWALCGAAAFFSTPELSYLALSLKVDAVVMLFELAAFLSLIMAVVIFWQDPKSRQNLKSAFVLSTAALFLSAFAFGSRFSGIISMVLCLGFCIYFLTKLTQRPFASFGISGVLFIFFMFIASPGYWVNWILYHNPIYPTKPFWPFQGGEYVYSMDSWKQYNIVGLPQGILQVYLIFALGSGLELLAKALPILNHLPMAAIRTQSMGWPNPLVFRNF